MNKNILIIGAGAVGQVYARHLKMANNKVYFFAKEKYAPSLRKELPVYPLNKKNPRSKPEYFKVDEVISSIDEVKNIKWDQIYLCISSTALRSESIKEFSTVIADATVVSLQGGLEDQEYVLNLFPKDQVVFGVISIISYQAPLPLENVPTEGIAYWFPPLSASPFCGNKIRVKEVVNELNSGGHPAKIINNIIDTVPYMSSALMSLIGVLEIEGWSFKNVYQSIWLKKSVLAISESTSIIQSVSKEKCPFGIKLISTPAIKLLIRLSPKVIPLDIETYLRVHFLKVKDQTLLYLDEIIKSGKKQSLPTKNLEEIYNKINNH